MTGTLPTRSAQKQPLKVAAWRVATRGGLAAARLARRPRTPPDYLIVGAQRAGTTSLYRYLTGHPSVMTARLTKGVHYFDSNYDRGYDWYLAHFPTKAKMARSAAELGRRVVTGEASPYYMFHPDIPRRIATTLPDVRVLVVLRDPVKRAWSQYHHEVARGYEHLPFEEALAAEPARLRGEERRLLHDSAYQSYSHRHHSYVARGIYAPQLERLFAHIPREQVLVVETDEMKRDSEGVYNEVLHHLDLEAHPLVAPVQHHVRPYPAMPEHVQLHLTAVFADANEQLFSLLGRRFSWGAR